jgi:hypothetical protein
MGAYAREQNVLTDDADHLTLLSDKKSDATWSPPLPTPSTRRRMAGGRRSFGGGECTDLLRR